MKLKMNHLKTILISAGFLIALALPLSAQESVDPFGDPAAGLAELTTDQAPADKSLLDMIKAGGWAMWPLGLLSVATVGLAIYNGFALRPANFFDQEVINTLEETITAGDFDAARELCTNNPGPITNTLGHVLDETLKGQQIHADSVEKAFEAASTKELTGPFVIVNYLSIIAAIAPMLGLLGTVSGMVKAFNAIAAQGMGRPELLADNISEALITTATGMTIGIPAMFFFFFFKNKYGKIVSDITLIVGRFYGDIVRSKKA